MESDHYKILPIPDAMKSIIPQKVNMMGIIFELGLSKRTKGTEYCCTLKVIDESHKLPGMTVAIYAEYLEGLPIVLERGDIIQLCNVMVKAHGEVVNAVYSKRFSSFALIGKESDYVVPHQVSSIFHPRDMDKNFIVKLRKLLVNIQSSEDSIYFPMLREIKEGDHCSLACKILHCCEAANNEWMLFVWDGTDTPPNFISAKIEDEMHDSLPLNMETRPLPRQILCTFPTVGSILRITIDQGIEKSLIQSLAIGKWVKIVDMRLEVHAGLWHGVLTPFTKLWYTPEEDCLIPDRLRLFDERVSLDWGRMPFTCFPWPSNVTEVDHENVLPVTLMDLLTHSEVTAKFKCIVRAVAIAPWLAENLRSPHGVYRFRLTLEDPTARIHAFVYGEDGETLFDGHPDNSILTEKMNLLLGVPPSDDNSTGAKSALRNPPWVQVCLKSYYTSPDDDVCGSRQYRIFDTKIVGGRP